MFVRIKKIVICEPPIPFNNITVLLGTFMFLTL